MKDVISILQSRIAKRENIIAQLLMLVEVPYQQEDGSVGTRWVSAFTPAHWTIIKFAEQQKQDKRSLAEIIRLRREIVDEKRGRKAVLELGCDCIEAHAKALEKSRKEVEELRAQIKELDAILDRFYRAEEI